MAATTSAVTRRPWGVIRLSWRHILILLGVAAAIAALSALPAVRWKIWEFLSLCRMILLGIAMIGVAIAAHAIHHWLKHGRQADKVESHESNKSPHSRVWFMGWLLGVVAIAGEIVLEFATLDIHRHLERRLPGPREFYSNHDLTLLVGRTIEVSILKVAENGQNEKLRCNWGALKQIASHAPDAWKALVDAEQVSDSDLARFGRNRRDVLCAHDLVPLGGKASAGPCVRDLTEPKLVSFLRDPARPAIDRNAWRRLMLAWEHQTHVTLDDRCRDALVEQLVVHFGVSLRESLKHDYAVGGKSWAALQLDVGGRLLEGLGALKSDSEEMNAAIAALGQDAKGLRTLLEQTRREGGDAANRINARVERITAALNELAASMPLQVEAIEVRHSRWRPDRSLSLKEADLREELRPILDGDSLRLIVRLSRPGHMRTLLLDSDGTRRWLPAEPASAPAGAVASLVHAFPASPTAHYDLNTGPGWQGFVVAVAVEEARLRALQRWVDDQFEWNRIGAQSAEATGVSAWLVEQGAVTPLERSRGEIVEREGSMPAEIAALARLLRRADDHGVVFGVFLRVEPGPKP